MTFNDLARKRDCPRYAVVNAATETVRKCRNREQGVMNFGE